MNWQDTRLNLTQIEKHYHDGYYDVESLLTEQAEISFKAGMQEVLDWIGGDIVVPEAQCD